MKLGHSRNQIRTNPKLGHHPPTEGGLSEIRSGVLLRQRQQQCSSASCANQTNLMPLHPATGQHTYECIGVQLCVQHSALLLHEAPAGKQAATLIRGVERSLGADWASFAEGETILTSNELGATAPSASSGPPLWAKKAMAHNVSVRDNFMTFLLWAAEPAVFPKSDDVFVQAAAMAAVFFRFLRQPNRPNAPRPDAKRGRAAGSGVAFGGAVTSEPDTS
jgi:hypothetical protein